MARFRKGLNYLVPGAKFELTIYGLWPHDSCGRGLKGG